LAKPPESPKSGKRKTPNSPRDSADRFAEETTVASSDAPAGVARTKLSAAEKRTRASIKRRFDKLCAFDHEFEAQGFSVIAGVDEAGRGALAGPVVCAAVVLRDESPLLRVNDSKQVEEAEREALFGEIIASALAVRISFGQPSAIDHHNILQATLMSMHRAVDALRPRPDLVLVDGRELFQWNGRMIPVIKGDGKSLRVAAASIVAKVARDRLMRRLHRRYPAYRFDQNKGYGTSDHWDAIRAHGVADVHRKTFVLKYVANNLSMF
jgi:ribonuclease HII